MTDTASRRARLIARGLTYGFTEEYGEYVLRIGGITVTLGALPTEGDPDFLAACYRSTERTLNDVAAIYERGDTAATERAASLDWLQLVRDHDMHGFVCACGADVNEQDRHLALMIRAAIRAAGAGKGSESDGN